MLNPLAFLAALRPGTARVPTVEWQRAGKPWRRPMRCPNCASDVAKAIRLAVAWKTITDPAQHTYVLTCPGCTASFFEEQKTPDYTEPSLMEKGRVPFYLQQGAGVSLITRPLARLNRPPGGAYLDVGCGFGFGLDFAVTERGWVGSGIDPAPIAALGREVLGVDVAPRYLDPSDAAGRACDVVMSSETIEHVRSPLAFVRTLRWALKPGGVLVLTTPDSDKLTPELPEATLVPLLSPGLHMVFQNRASLAALLAGSGFAHVLIEEDGYSLVAYASDAPLTLEDDPAVVRGRYRTYLERRARLAPAGGDLFLGMAGRALAEAAGDGDAAAAARAWDLLVPACRARFGIDLDDPSLPHPAAAAAPLERMAELMPLNLAAILYARAMLLLMQGAPRAQAEPTLRAAVRAAEALRRALHDIAIDDVQTADLAWTARSELTLCAAERGAPDVAETLARLPHAPGQRAGEAGARRDETAARAMTALVNAGRHALARSVVGREEMQRAAWADAGRPGALPPALRDGLFCLAVLDLQDPADPARARERMRRVQELAAGGDQGPASLFHAALRGELQAAVAMGLAPEADALRARVAGAGRAVQAAAE